MEAAGCDYDICVVGCIGRMTEIKIQKLCRGAELCKRKVIESIVAYISQVVLFKSGFAFVLEFLETNKDVWLPSH